MWKRAFCHIYAPPPLSSSCKTDVSLWCRLRATVGACQLDSRVSRLQNANEDVRFSVSLSLSARLFGARGDPAPKLLSLHACYQTFRVALARLNTFVSACVDV